MIRTTLAAAAVASLALAGTAAAAQAPTAGPATIITAGQKTPIAIAGNHLLAGATIRKGTEVRRWLITLHGVSKKTLTLSCGPGGRNTGLGQQDSTNVAFAVPTGSNYGHRTLAVRFYATPHGKTSGSNHGSVYAVCHTA